jgi:hypothetical protein
MDEITLGDGFDHEVPRSWRSSGDEARCQRRSIFTMLGFVLVGALGGCDLVPCNEGDSRCSDNQVWYCSKDDDEVIAHWYSGGTCTTACAVLADEGATCVDSAQPVPDCAQADSICWQGEPATCDDGYPIIIEPLCGDGATCEMVSGCGPVCALGPLEPKCAGISAVTNGDFPTICDDVGPAVCACGFVISHQSCGSGTCVPADGGPICE